jgi:hypothetical protein
VTLYFPYFHSCNLLGMAQISEMEAKTVKLNQPKYKLLELGIIHL